MSTMRTWERSNWIVKTVVIFLDGWTRWRLSKQKNNREDDDNERFGQDKKECERERERVKKELEWEEARNEGKLENQKTWMLRVVGKKSFVCESPGFPDHSMKRVLHRRGTMYIHCTTVYSRHRAHSTKLSFTTVFPIFIFLLSISDIETNREWFDP